MKSSDRKLVSAQIKKSEEKLAAANALVESQFFDDAISRAYYAMFHAASAVLLTEGISVDSHSALKAMFGLHLVETGRIARQYGKWLSRLKDDRENGDYDIYTDFSVGEAGEALQIAERFLSEMKRFLRDTAGFEI